MPTRYIGKPMSRVDGVAKVTGKAKYAAEFDVPNVAYGFVVTGTIPKGRRTLTFEYVSPDGKIKTGYFYATGFEELQIGLGPDAQIYDLDDIDGAVTPDPNLKPFEPPTQSPSYCQGKTAP